MTDPKWEYLVASAGAADLNALGADGWELVAVAVTRGGGSLSFPVVAEAHTLYLKRPLIVSAFVPVAGIATTGGHLSPTDDKR